MKRETDRFVSSFILPPSSFDSLALHLMHRVPAQPGAVLLDLDLLRAARHLDLGAVVQVTGLGALQPDHFSALFSHGTSPSNRQIKNRQWSVVRRQLPDDNCRPTTDH